MIITQELFTALEKHLLDKYPYEACGILLGDMDQHQVIRLLQYIPVPNTAPNPLHHFELDPGIWINHVLGTPNLIGLFHSHPNSAPCPSPYDLESLQQYGALLQVYLIGSLTYDKKHMELRGYTIQKDEEKLTLTESSLSMT